MPLDHHDHNEAEHNHAETEVTSGKTEKRARRSFKLDENNILTVTNSDGGSEGAFDVKTLPDSILDKLSIIGLQHLLRSAEVPGLLFAGLQANEMPQRKARASAGESMPGIKPKDYWRQAVVNAMQNAAQEKGAAFDRAGAIAHVAGYTKKQLSAVKTKLLVVAEFNKLTGGTDDLGV